MGLQVRVGCEFDFETDYPVPMLMLVRVRPGYDYRVQYEARWLHPEVPLREYTDTFGNICWRLVAPGGPLTIRYDALVEVPAEPEPHPIDLPQTQVEDLPDETLVYTLPSRYVQSDLLMDEAWRLFGNTPPTGARVQAICDWIHENVRYETGCSSPTITALDVYTRRVAVCRDFALLACAFCRALNIPARYAFGYLPDIGVPLPDAPQDFHAWFDVWLGNRWYTFDARFNRPRIGRITVGAGRDAVDVALTTSYGAARLNRLTVWADEVTALAAGTASTPASFAGAAGSLEAAAS